MKKGVSLIAVLMFMLAATTASVVLFKWIGQENFGSGARLKKSEAYQASQAGLEAVQGWLTNKGADAGALITAFKLNNGKPVLMKAGDYDLLGEITGNKGQNFKVYLTGVNTQNPRAYKMKFLSVGEGRDGSKYSQAGIFNVEGLYRIGLEPKDRFPPPPPPPPGYVPEYFGGIGKGTQFKFSSAHIIGDLETTGGGLSSTGDVIVTGKVKVVSGATIGCPNTVGQGSSYPSDYAARKANGEFNNAYVKEDFSAQNILICGDAYIGGSLSSIGTIEIWGNLYVGGSIISENTLRVYGNVTVEGNIEFKNVLDIKGNLIMPPAPNSTHSIKLNNANSVSIGPFWGANTVNCSVSQGSNKCNIFTSSNAYPGVSAVQPFDGGNPLDYLGKQISKDRENVNGKNIYTIPDPIVLGAAAEWKASDIPPSGCTDLKNFSGYSNGVITLKNENGNIQDATGARTFRNAIHSCYNNSDGNWSGSANRTKWLVIRINWQNPNDAISKEIFGLASEMNLIFVIENKPTENLSLPLTTENTNILLYLTQGAKNIFLDRPPGIHNYFIYSEENIDEINGSQYLKGNLFMANGKEVKDMKDAVIAENKKLYEALTGAGVIANNPDACDRTVGGCGEGGGFVPGTGGGTPEPQPLIGCDPIEPGCDPKLSYVPVIPYLKVELQSQYASEENITNASSAKPAILVMPRVIYLQANEQINTLPKLAERIKVLYLNVLNGPNPADKPSPESIMQSNCSNILGQSESGLYSCTLILSGCSEDELCKNSFYIAKGVQPTVEPPEEPIIEPEDSSSSSSNPSSSSSSSSSSSVPPPALGLTCSISPAVAEGSKISDAVTALCTYDDGSYDWAIIDQYYDGSSWISASDTTSTLGRGTKKAIKIRAKCSSTDQIAEYNCCSASTDPCGTIDIVGITCAFSTKLTTTIFAKGEQINGPTVGCSNDPKSTAVKDDAKFSSVQNPSLEIVPITNVNSITSHPINSTDTIEIYKRGINEKGWKSYSGFAYFASGPVGPAGENRIRVENASCGNISGLSVDCASIGTLTVRDPTCTPASGSHPAGSPITIPVLCKTGVPMTNAVFSSTSDWRNNGNGGAFTEAGGGSRNITLTSGECWGRIVSGLDIPCGTVTVTEPNYNSGGCDYRPEWCGYIARENVDKVSYNYPQTNSEYATGCTLNDPNNPKNPSCSNIFEVGSGGKCVFATSITTMGNTNNCSYYRVNGVELKGPYNNSLDLNDTSSGSCSVGSGRCGRINLDNGNPNWGQQLCSNALANVPKADGGYYIYIAPGRADIAPGRAGDFITTGGTPVCNGGGGNATLSCTNLQSTVLQGGTITAPTVSCNGETISNPSWGGRPNNNGNWNVPSNAAVNQEYTITATASCGGSNLMADCGTVKVVAPLTVKCNTENLNSCYVKGNNVPRPNTFCSDGTPTPGEADFRISGGDGGRITDWNNPNTNAKMWTTGTNRTITLRELMCGNNLVTPSTPVTCGTVNIKEDSCVPTATCTDKIGVNGVKLGQNIGPPAIICSNGSTPSLANVSFSGNTPTNVNNWKNNGNAYYSGGETEGTKTVTVSSIPCENTSVNTNCKIDVSKPTCSVGNTTVTSGAIINPTVSCGGNSLALTSSSFGTTTTGCSWDGSGSGGTISRSTTGTCNLKLNSLTCDNNNTIYGIDKACDGTITVNVASTCENLDLSTNNAKYIVSGKCYKITAVKTGNNGKDCGEIRVSCAGEEPYVNGVCSKSCTINNQTFTCNSSNIPLEGVSVNSILNTSGTNTKDWQIQCQYKD
ncbi:MAG: hypothetical protein LBQ87_00860 [Candidatus Fibromonas sp.]|jgi:hypothetical protein|nr:hypothetical protein [Candidatus Fibromonas sp.]